jgi:hypothetical protein
VFISALSLWWSRWALPLFPLAAIGAAYLADRVFRRLDARWRHPWPRVASLVMAGLLLVPLIPPLVENLAASTNGDDTRLRTNAWVEERVPPGSTLLIDSYTTQVSSDDYDVRVIQDGRIVPWQETHDKAHPDGYFGVLAGQWVGSPDELIEAVEEAGVDYVFLSDIWIDLLRREIDRYPTLPANYQILLDTFPTIERFDADDAEHGSPITILSITTGE